MKNKIEIKSIFDSILFEYDIENNDIRKTLEQAVLIEADLRGAVLIEADLRGANLRGANLFGADLRGANLIEADLRGAVLSRAVLSRANLRRANLREADLIGANLLGADLSEADLRGANLRGANLIEADLRGANLIGADLRGANLRCIAFGNLPQSWIDACSKDILYIFHTLKNELPEFKKKLLAGEIDGTQYKGYCACLVGTFSNIEKKNVNVLCDSIPFYHKGTDNPGEQWFLNIHEGDTPENNGFSKHVLKLINMVLKEEDIKPTKRKYVKKSTLVKKKQNERNKV